MNEKLPRPEFNGKRFRGADKLAVYLVDRGELRHIPSQTTFDLLFGADWANVRVGDPDMNSIPFGRPLAEGTYLARAEGREDIYLISPFGVKRRLQDKTTLEKYNFDQSKIKRLSVQELDSFLEGPPVE